MKNKCSAVIVAAGQGRRMNSNTPKQYLTLDDKPILFYTLKAFEASDINDITLVVGDSEVEYCRREIIERYHIEKVSSIIAGGKERYESVYFGLNALTDAEYVLIHDGARPFIEPKFINEIIDYVKICKACIVGVPVKDTIRIADEEGLGYNTPERKNVFSIQTPQAFETALIKSAYEILMNQGDIAVTDDAMVVEKTMNKKIEIITGSYSNIKITTPEDLIIGEAILRM